jgi:helicase
LLVSELPLAQRIIEILEAYGYSALYPPQEEAIRAHVLSGTNLVLASPTASGKTLVAELCALRHILDLGGKVLYLTPLRALASEKFEDFKKYEGVIKPDGNAIRIAISSGDYDSSDPWLARYDIIITTNEKADSLLRHGAHWMSEVSLVVADEIHLLNDADRGPTLEVVMTRLRQINSKAQLLALSATVRNSEEIAEWIKAKAITTEWRPVKLREGVYLDSVVEFNDGYSTRLEEMNRTSSLNVALNYLKEDLQTLIFAETRKTSVELSKKLAPLIRSRIGRQELRALKTISERILASGERTRVGQLLAELVSSGTAFHHAGLSPVHRRIVEEAFKSGKIKILVATPTLAAGVNLPARAVVVNSYMRYEVEQGRYPIPVLEYKQMSGRAGRPRYDEIGESILIAKTEDERDYLMENYVLAKPERIWSKLGIEGTLRTHVLATIASGFAHSERGVFDFFDMTLYAHQYSSDSIRRPVTKVLEYLEKEDMIEIDGDTLSATPFGKRVSELYIDPVSGVVLRDGLKQAEPHMSDFAYLHMISRTPDLAPKMHPRRHEMSLLSRLVDEHRPEFILPIPGDSSGDDYEIFLAEVKCAAVLESWIQEMTEDEIIERFGVEPGDLFRLRDSADWLIYACHELASLFRLRDKLKRLEELRSRVESGVKHELLPLVRLEGIGRVRGRALYNAGLKTLEDLRRAPIERIASVPTIGPAIAKKVKEQVGGVVSSEEWARIKEQEVWEQRALTEFREGAV